MSEENRQLVTDTKELLQKALSQGKCTNDKSNGQDIYRFLKQGIDGSDRAFQVTDTYICDIMGETTFRGRGSSSTATPELNRQQLLWVYHSLDCVLYTSQSENDKKYYDELKTLSQAPSAPPPGSTVRFDSSDKNNFYMYQGDTELAFCFKDQLHRQAFLDVMREELGDDMPLFMQYSDKPNTLYIPLSLGRPAQGRGQYTRGDLMTCYNSAKGNIGVNCGQGYIRDKLLNVLGIKHASNTTKKMRDNGIETYMESQAMAFYAEHNSIKDGKKIEGFSKRIHDKTMELRGDQPQMTQTPHSATQVPGVEIVISDITLEKIKDYKQRLEKNGVGQAGKELQSKLSDQNIANIALETFTELLLSTKKPKCFAESEIEGGNWTMAEVSILGDIGTFVHGVEIYDNGNWDAKDAKKYAPPRTGNFLFTAGALLKGPTIDMEGSDFKRVMSNDKIDDEKYYKFCEERLLPLLLQANQDAYSKNKNAFVAIPGIGCGEFAGTHASEVQQKLPGVLQKVLQNHKDSLTYIQAIRFDLGPSGEHSKENSEYDVGDIKFIFKSQGAAGQPQLTMPEEFKPEYRNCEFYKVVAGDPVSYPGNDSYVDSRYTDEGVMGHATNLMKVVTGKEGKYEEGQFKRQDGREWEITHDELSFDVKGKIMVMTSSGEKKVLRDNEVIGTEATTPAVEPEAPVLESAAASSSTNDLPKEDMTFVKKYLAKKFDVDQQYVSLAKKEGEEKYDIQVDTGFWRNTVNCCDASVDKALEEISGLERCAISDTKKGWKYSTLTSDLFGLKEMAKKGEVYSK